MYMAGFWPYSQKREYLELQEIAQESELGKLNLPRPWLLEPNESLHPRHQESAVFYMWIIQWKHNAIGVILPS